jgi:hypothetical protein
MRMREGIEARKPRYRASCPSVSGEPTRRRRLYNFFPTIAIIRRRTLLLTAYTSCDTAKNRRSVRREAEASGISGLPAKRPTQRGAEHQFWSSSRRFGFAHEDRHSRVPLWPFIALRTRLGASRFEKDLPVPRLHVVLASLRLAHVPLTGTVCVGCHPGISCGWAKPTA